MIRTRPRFEVSVEAFLLRRRFHQENLPLWLELTLQGPTKPPDRIEIRRVADLNAVPQGRCNFSVGAGARTTVTTLPIDYAAGRRCR